MYHFHRHQEKILAEILLVSSESSNVSSLAAQLKVLVVWLEVAQAEQR